jgi:hypothetical protein
MVARNNAQSCSSINQLSVIGQFVSQKNQAAFAGKCKAVAVACVEEAAEPKVIRWSPSHAPPPRWFGVIIVKFAHTIVMVFE